MAIYLEDFTVGAVLEHGRYEVTAAEIKAFAGQYDPQTFHLDEEAGAKSAMGVFCASGWHTAAMAMRMMVDEGKRKGGQSMGSPGIDELRWLRPVLPGDILSLRQTIFDVRPSASKLDRGLVQSKTEVLNQRGEVVMHFAGMVFYKKREAA
jgi:acyl dehydratase